VRGNFLDRRYSDDELRRIFAAAARADVRSQRAEHPVDGYTIADLREIAAEVGIDPAAIEEAAANLVASDDADRTVRRSLFDRVIHEEITIARALSDTEMRAVVIQAETVIGRVGTLREAGDWVEWRDPKDRFYVGLARGRSQTRIRVIGDFTAEMVNAAAGIGLVGTLTASMVAGSATAAGLVAGGLSIATVPVLIAWYWRRRSMSSRNDLRELLAILRSTVAR
jgi:hypothetical protein